MIGLFLLLAAQATVAAPADTPPPAPPPARKVCRRPPGSDTIICRPRQQQESYRLNHVPAQSYGPALPSAGSIIGPGVKVRGQASNSGSGRRKRSGATLSVPF